MTTSIELQVISKLLVSENPAEIEALCEFDTSYYSVFRPHAEFIFNHRDQYGNVPDRFTFQAQFPEFVLVEVKESFEYLKREMLKNKKHIILIETFNTLKDMGSSDVDDAWNYLDNQCDRVATLDATEPLDLVKDAELRSKQVVEYAQQRRIPTGFPEIDKCMYGGLSTVEELVIIVARTNTGKSWVGTKMMETAQKNGFPVLYYSPEMQAAFLGTRFDTWRSNFENSKLHQGTYSEQYFQYIKSLANEETSAFVLEDKNVPDGEVNVTVLKRLVKKHGIKLLVIDGLSYMFDDRGRKGDADHIKYKNMCADLFRLSKQCGCAVVVMMQANRETQNSKDQKGDPFPNIYNIEGSDHPARIATQVFALRQVFEKHILDIRLEKARNANNQKPCFSYSWDINTGNMRYIPESESGSPDSVTPIINPGFAGAPSMTTTVPFDDSDDDFDEVEF